MVDFLDILDEKINIFCECYFSGLQNERNFSWAKKILQPYLAQTNDRKMVVTLYTVT